MDKYDIEVLHLRPDINKTSIYSENSRLNLFNLHSSWSRNHTIVNYQ